MPSPFPGMNPYLEQDDAWHDFHERFLPALADRLIAQVRPNYIVKIDEHVYVHEVPEGSRRLVGRGDLSVDFAPDPPAWRPALGVLEAPVRVETPIQDVERLAFLEVRTRQGRELVTVVELLSPSNKRSGTDREQYLAKREALLRSRAHLVEIDLLRGGRPLPAIGRPDCAYSVLVSRVEGRSGADFWPIGLRDRLPTISVPLRDPDGDAVLELQESLHRVYDASGYEDYIYGGSPDPPLSAADADWARAIVRGAG